MDMTNRDYLTDEELMALIEDVEKNSMMSAPKIIKSDVYSEINRLNNRQKSVAIMTYRFKVISGVAAAILIFCVMPFKTTSSLQRAQYASMCRDEEYQSYIDRIEAKEERENEREQFVEKIIDKIDNVWRIK